MRLWVSYFETWSTCWMSLDTSLFTGELSWHIRTEKTLKLFSSGLFSPLKYFGVESGGFFFLTTTKTPILYMQAKYLYTVSTHSCFCVPVNWTANTAVQMEFGESFHHRRTTEEKSLASDCCVVSTRSLLLAFIGIMLHAWTHLNNLNADQCDWLLSTITSHIVPFWIINENSTSFGKWTVALPVTEWGPLRHLTGRFSTIIWSN